MFGETVNQHNYLNMLNIFSDRIITKNNQRFYFQQMIEQHHT